MYEEEGGTAQTAFAGALCYMNSVYFRANFMALLAARWLYSLYATVSVTSRRLAMRRAVALLQTKSLHSLDNHALSRNEQ